MNFTRRTNRSFVGGLLLMSQHSWFTQLFGYSFSSRCFGRASFFCVYGSLTRTTMGRITVLAGHVHLGSFMSVVPPLTVVSSLTTSESGSNGRSILHVGLSRRCLCLLFRADRLCQTQHDRAFHSFITHALTLTGRSDENLGA